VRDEHQNTPLYYAAVMGREEDFKLVKALIEHGANVNAVCQNRLTPLFQASMWGRLDVVEYLVAKGADVSAKNDGGDTPLHLAASTYVYSSSDIPAIVNFLLSHGASPWAKNDSGKLPIQLAKEPIPKGGRDYDKLVQQQREVITMLRHAMHRHDYQAN
jgi:ankyrin repeat protein